MLALAVRWVLELTRWGYEAEVMLQDLGRWATRSPLHDPTLPLSAASIMMSFRKMYSHERAKGEAATIGFRFGADGFVMEFGSDGIRAAINRFLDEHNEEPKPFTWTADPGKIIAAVRRGHQALNSSH